jgi:sigma-E factor negative regulatory protein RseA
MKQEISALMDGELYEDEADTLLGQVRRDGGAQSDWAVYHLIGDVLRQPEHIHRDLGDGVRARMQDEPTVLAPRSRAVTQKVRTVALSAAASVAAVGVVAWMSLQIAPEKAPQLAMQDAPMRPVSMQIHSKSNDYLTAHQEFSPSADMTGGTAYIRTVAYSLNEKQ